MASEPSGARQFRGLALVSLAGEMFHPDQAVADTLGLVVLAFVARVLAR